MNSITPLNYVGNTHGAKPKLPEGIELIGKKQPGNFSEVLKQSLYNVNEMQQDADKLVEALATGEEVSQAEVLTAVRKAELAFRMLLQVRNKLSQAFTEIKQIRV